MLDRPISAPPAEPYDARTGMRRVASSAEIAAAVAPLAGAPSESAIFSDLDGTLAPIVDRADATALPEPTRVLLERIAGRFAQVGIVSGRQALEARRIVGIDGLTYVGNHGFELLEPGAAEPRPAPELDGLERRAARFAEALDRERLAAVELRGEDKGAIQALHWRGARDEAAAEGAARRIAGEAEASGLATHWGRKVLELRPPVSLDKGSGIRACLRARAVRSAFYAGDDRTDADAFRALGEMVSAGELEAALRVAVLSDETPEEVGAAADLAVEGTGGLLAVLEALV